MPSDALVEVQPLSKSAKMLSWRIGLVGQGGLGYDENKRFVHFNTAAFFSTATPGDWFLIKEQYGLPVEEFESAGKMLEEKIPNAYARSYKTILSRTRIFAGNTEVKNYFLQKIGPGKTKELLEGLVDSLTRANMAIDSNR